MVVYLVDRLRRLQYEREREIYCKLASVSIKRTYLKKKFKNSENENFSCDVGFRSSRDHFSW